LSAFFKSKKLSPAIVPQYYTVNLFLRRGVDACTVMYYNEYHVLYQSGIDASQLSTFFLRDHGIDFPEDGIYCLRATRDRSPETCRALREATLEGWKYASEHPDETLDVVMKHVNEAKLPTNRTHMQWMLTAVLSSVFPAKESAWKPGGLSQTSYEQATRWLLELGQLKAAPTYEEFTR